MKETYHWSDIAAKKILKEKGNKSTYTCAAGITPSGTTHIGNFREIITVDLVVKALQKLKKKTRFIYSWDDFDRFRKVPTNIPKNFKKYIGMPLSDIPDPWNCHKSYALHFEKKVENSLKLLNMQIKFIRQSEMYKKCKYADEIKKALNNKNKIIKILNKYRKEHLKKNWWPLSIYCEKCKKDSTKILNYDKNYQVEYKCNCGFSNKIDFSKKGIVKLPWRICWPMRQFYEKVDFEPGGKDHFAAGGSYDTSKEIIKEIWKREAPSYVIYEWISIKGGKQFSSSLGNVITIKDCLEVYEPEILRYLFASTRPKTEFAISFDLDVLKIYEDFDKCERIYYEKERLEEKKQEIKQKRIYELSLTKKPFKTIPKQLTFRHLSMLTQIHEGNIDNAVKKYKSSRIKKRAELAWNWLQKYAPNTFKFNLNEEIPEKIIKSLNKQQKQALKLLKSSLEKHKFDEQSLFNEFYKICQSVNLKNTDFFKAAYLVLINKEQGPRLSPFILAIGKRKIIKLLKQVK